MNGHCDNSAGLEAVCERYVRLRRGMWHPTTVRRHDYRLRRFVRCLRALDPELKHFDQLRRCPHIEHWLLGLRDLGPVSRLSDLYTLRLFFQAQNDWGWPHPPAENLLRPEDFPRRPQHLPKPLEPADDQRLQEALRQRPCIRSLAVQLLRQSGLRVGELLALSVDAISTDAEGKPLLRVPPAKTGRERLIPLGEEAAAILGAILRLRGARRPPAPCDAHRLMLEESGAPLRYHSLWRHLKRVGRSAGVCPHQSLHLHRMRHTFATALARTDIPFPSLMRLLGHRKPEMTMRYVELSARDIRHAYEQALAQLSALPLRLRSTRTPPAEPAAQIREQFHSLIARIEHHRRDCTDDPTAAQTLARLVKRLRAAQRAFKLIP